MEPINESNDEIKRCLNPSCRKQIHGRFEQMFCNNGCRYTYHNLRKIEETRITGKITNTIKRNRRILEKLLKDKDVTSVTEQKLLGEGFNFQYHTHIRHSKNGESHYTFCFNLGYRKLADGCIQIVRAW